MMCELCEVANRTGWLGPSIFFGCILIVAVVAYLLKDRIKKVLTQRKKLIEDISSAGTVLFLDMQIILLVKSNHSSLGGSEMPSPYGPLLKHLSFLTLDLIQWLPLNCAYEEGFTALDGKEKYYYILYYLKF